MRDSSSSAQVRLNAPALQGRGAERDAPKSRTRPQHRGHQGATKPRRSDLRAGGIPMRLARHICDHHGWRWRTSRRRHVWSWTWVAAPVRRSSMRDTLIRRLVRHFSALASPVRTTSESSPKASMRSPTTCSSGQQPRHSPGDRQADPLGTFWRHGSEARLDTDAHDRRRALDSRQPMG